MGSLTNILRYPGELYPLVKLKMAIRHAEKQFPTEPPHWAFCHSTLPKVSSNFALVIQQLGPQPQLRDSFCILYLVLRALDTVEDDMSLAAEVKLPILRNFHRHIYDRDWKFSCGTKHDKALMDGFYHVSTAFQELGSSCREIIEDTTMRMGEGMAKYVCKEIETITECEEYMNYISSLYLSANLKLSHDLAGEDFSRDSLSSSLGLLHQKAHNIEGFYEDINEMPKKTLFWPRQIWSKYVDKLEDFKFEENSVKAVQCLNEMVTHALCHAEDCLKFMSNFQDPAIFRFFAIPRVMAIGTLALCYNNIQVFRRDVKMRPGLRAKVFDQIRTMSDVYGAFYDISCIMKSKVDNNDPNAAETLRILKGIQKACKESGTLTTRDSFIFGNKAKLNNIALD